MSMKFANAKESGLKQTPIKWHGAREIANGTY